MILSLRNKNHCPSQFSMQINQISRINLLGAILIFINTIILMSNYSMIWIKSILLIVAITFTACKPRNASQVALQKNPKTFERMPYNNSGLTVDLGVGLLASPLPVDFDGDGDMDILFSCNDVPCDGIYLFENTSGEVRPGKRIFYSVNGTYDRKNGKIDSLPSLLRLNEKQFGSSGRRKLAFGDWDGDGDIDIIVNGINAVLLENVGQTPDSVEFKYHGNFSDKKLAGHSTSPTLVNWGKSGKPDLLLGAEDGYFYYWTND